MGYARIISGGPDGRYTIELDFGDATLQAIQDALSGGLATLDVRLGQALALVAEAEEKEDALQLLLDTAIATYTEQAQQLSVGGVYDPYRLAEDTGVRFLLYQKTQLVLQHKPLRDQVARIRFARIRLLQQVAYYAQVDPTSTREAWCADLTEDGAVGSLVGTLDIPGDSSLVLIAPGCREPLGADGYLKARALLSPEQAYFNAAILPGWQKWRPTYRWGTVTSIDYEADTMTVALAPAQSSAQELPINQASVLTDVPVVYMTCNAEAFEVNDRVVVQFVGQDWGAPRVIGFLDNPRPCFGWLAILALRIQNGVSGEARYAIVVMRSVAPNARILDDIDTATDVYVDFRVNRGEWSNNMHPFISSPPSPLINSWLLYHDEVTPDMWQVPGNSPQATPAAVVTFSGPGFAPSGTGQTFSPLEGAPAHLRITYWVPIGFAPFGLDSPSLSPISRFPVDSILEFRLWRNGELYANIACQINYEPYIIDTGLYVPEDATNVELLDYVRFSEDGT